MTPVFFIIVLEFYLYLYPLNPLSICLILIKYAAAAKSLQSCTTLYDLIDSSPPGSSVPGILQARTLEWVAISFSNTCMPAMSLQSCLTMCNAIDSSPPGSVHMILQVRILEWVAISFSNKVQHCPVFQERNVKCLLQKHKDNNYIHISFRNFSSAGHISTRCILLEYGHQHHPPKNEQIKKNTCEHQVGKKQCNQKAAFSHFSKRTSLK